MSAELFLEIGTEEIPAGFLPQAMADLQRLIRKEFESARIAFAAVRTYATPRRLALVVEGVAATQERQELSLMGPSVKVAFDAEGNPTKAAQGFARSNGVEVAELSRAQTDKGEYLFIAKVIEGRPTAELLPEMLPRLINAIPFKKSMRWADLDVRFARPVHWIVALFDGVVVPFSIGNLHSGHLSRGHRFMAPDAFAVSGEQSWLAECERHFVLSDPKRRQDLIAKEIERTAAAAGGRINPDPDLLEEVSYLVEFPVPLCGSFEEKYLQLPRELLITTMREHQRYFTLTDDQGNLLPRFITIANTEPRDPAVVVKGNQRVLRARLDDAMFFWQEDQKHKLETRLEALKNVVYQAKLGTSHEKVMRFKAIAESLAEKFEPEARDLTARAALLAKCDLETGMVYEFPELQGVMGREYARLEGENPRVCAAIYEHYLPLHAGGDLPSESIGAYISIADKIDTLCGCFGVGLIPTGTADPYALRRNAIGILNIILDRGLALSVPALVAQSLELLRAKLTRPAEEVRGEVIEFIRLRFLNMLTGQGYPQDVVDAVLAAGFVEPVDALQRVKALAEMKRRADFEPLAVAFKRVVNIIKGGVPDPVRPELLEAACEKQLADAVARAAEEVRALVARGDYAAALQVIAGLRAPVDAYFDGVMVMAEDVAVRTNRLALLTQVARLFEGIADFSRISE
ncbi:glycine--tRNA ligase subunit beta [Geoalkalibacter halelectricus]|uniref:Glycine--tRNA ligase beta subunit n=1 Tax=Geoalkalibacter halelectricus TaxID=2847045 RepID=A0ABY5ZL99_9BACT|nr:glycine--tRNA ligase subunit beta [Geoalkalibacter halelectricus]MDO3378775.1 glycine--tRNA ligase subunit beta [Geoalkalibacter halelectricus]UWZ79920.1 glycine--tRNA ligase subunit beta [Geoalkalibacter halelectricus]